MIKKKQISEQTTISMKRTVLYIYLDQSSFFFKYSSFNVSFCLIGFNLLQIFFQLLKSYFRDLLLLNNIFEERLFFK